jgi:NAD(P)-dependent dehydrogenase (short-subunit alcohol dehydrogenase family)
LIVVTGATGYVGGAVVRRLLAQGLDVAAMARDAGAAGERFEFRASDSIFKQPSAYACSIPRRATPGLCMYLPPQEGVGNAGCPLHPRSRVQ